MKRNTGERLRRLSFEEPGSAVGDGLRFCPGSKWDKGFLAPSHGRELTVGVPGGVGGCRLSLRQPKTKPGTPAAFDRWKRQRRKE